MEFEDMWIKWATDNVSWRREKILLQSFGENLWKEKMLVGIAQTQNVSFSIKSVLVY